MGILKERKKRQDSKLGKAKGMKHGFAYSFYGIIQSASQLSQGGYACLHSLHWASKTLGFKKLVFLGMYSCSSLCLFGEDFSKVLSKRAEDCVTSDDNELCIPMQVKILPMYLLCGYFLIQKSRVFLIKSERKSWPLSKWADIRTDNLYYISKKR